MDKYIVFTDEEIEMAKNVDMMSYLSSKGYRFTKSGTNRYLIEPHSSLVLFTGTNSWYSFKENKGGNLINFLQYYENKTFQEAMVELVGEPQNREKVEHKKYTPVTEEKEEIVLPNANKNNKRAYSYLTKTRSIDNEIVNKLIEQGDIYENDKGGVVFLGKDKENKVKFACVRSTNEKSKFRQDVKNSEKEYGFKTVGTSNRLFVFEAPIDLLSHATISKMQEEDWEKDSRISLGGTSDKALNKFLEENNHIEEIILFLDNDEAGIENAKKIANKYGNDYNVKMFYSTKGKDLNEMLLNYKAEKEVNNYMKLKDFIKKIEISPISQDINNKDISLVNNKNISNKTKKINSLKSKYEETLNNLNSKEDFKHLLDTAIRFNKYPFDNVVLIHNQNPNAEFLATYGVWNKNVGRYINKGAKGIGVLELDKPTPTYRYLFELKDTNGSDLSYKKVLNYKWEVKEEDKSSLIKSINKNLGTSYESLNEYLYNRIVEEVAKKDGYFENIQISEQDKNNAYYLVISSLEYMILKRCNYEIDLPNDLDFGSIKNIELFSKIGSLATDISRDILKDVFIQVKKLEKEKERKGELENGREINESYEKSNSRRQDDSRENGNRGNGILRGRDDRNTISDNGDGGGRNRTEPNTVWNDVERISGGEQKTYNNNFSDERRTEPKDERSTGDSRLLRGENGNGIIGETTNATIGQDTRESIASNTNIPSSERNDNQGHNRESSILIDTEETQEPKENIGSFSIEEDKISYIKYNIGKEITLNKGKFIIEDVNDLLNEVKLGKDNVLYPVFKNEKVDVVYEILKNQELKLNIQEEKVTILEKEIGNIISYQGKLYELEEIDKTNSEYKVVLKSLDDNSPVIQVPTKIEFLDNVYDEYIKNQDIEEEIIENFDIDNISKIDYIDNEITEDFILDSNMEQTQNYVYSEEHNLYDGGAKTRAKTNIEIIKLLRKIEEEDRQATLEEQIILAGYNGFGGIANVLGNKIGFEEEYQTFKNILTEDEFKSARKTTTTAFYTEQKIVQAMYKALNNFGFEQGKILDPSMGTGNFFSVLPNKMKNSTLYGVELDSITGRIARQLYPNANISIQGFEETNYPNNYFDVAISNIPFNNLQVNDPNYNSYNFKIHDYFIAKMIDKVKPNGIVGIIATKGVLDKKDSSLREYVNERAGLVGAIRLPNNAFKQVANTEVTTDIIFFQKREQPLLELDNNARWLNISEDENGILINNYFIDNPQMILGQMVFDKSMYGDENLTACKPFENANLYELLNKAIENLHCTYKSYEIEHQKEIQEAVNIENSIKNLSYGIIDNEIYYKESNQLIKEKIQEKDVDRLKGLIGVNLALRDIIEFQTLEEIYSSYNTEDFNNELKNKIETLNIRYDDFVAKYGYINNKENTRIFKKDISLPLLKSIEKEINGTNKFEKTDIFYKPTIKIKSEVKIENAEDSLKVCLNDLGRVDIDYMSKLYNKSKDEIIEELSDKIFQDPILYNKNNIYTGYVTSNEYLTGYVKEKLAIAREKAKDLPIFEKNVKALEQVQPIPLKPSEIGFALGSTWIPPNIYKEFIDELFELKGYSSGYTKLNYLEHIGEYFIEGKSLGGVKIDEVYGTKRMSALKILENTLNLRPIKVNDTIEEVDKKTGETKKKSILNVKETILAKAKQEEIKIAFQEFITKDEKRLEYLTNIYNEKFNNFVTRKYDGSNLELPNMSNDITLRDYQKDVIARAIYSNSNVLIAHEVGAGKTFSAIASVYEQKRLGIVNKPLIVVPNHLTKQWGNEFLRLYPSANILVADKKDFQKDNRQKFISKIATNNFDAIIMSHSSFEKINISKETRLNKIEEEIENITESINEMSSNIGRKNDWSIKQLEILKNNLEVKYEKLYKESEKDNHINFEELGVDSLVIDESHRYKNNFIYTKMHRVAGINTSSSNRAMDVHLKAQYITELNNGKGVIYLTGTPITNSMSELYVLQNTLQAKDLEKKGINSFDKWVSTFGIVEESDEIKPEGTGYQKKMRLSKFHNLPELMKMFNNIADVKTAETLNLPRPTLKTGKEQILKAELTEDQKLIVDLLVDRAENIRNGSIDPEVDNFLKITLDARLLSIDPRILDNEIPYNANTKLNLCARKVAEIYHETVDNKSTQLIFCDSGVPKENEFNFYDTIKKELLENGVSKDEIAYIHSAKTDEQKEKLFEKVRNGEIRILIGSTERMGVGTNVQNKLYALHNLDIPWRPDQLIQRNGRILRQGNENKEVEIFNYITEGSFDSYLYQILENKQKFISQVMTEKSPLRACDDIDEVVLNYAEIKGIAMKNPFMKEKMQVETEINKLNLLKGNWLDNKESYKDKIEKLPLRIENLEKSINSINLDTETYKNNKPSDFEIIINGVKFNDRAKAGEYFMSLKSKLEREKNTNNIQEVGSYAGLKVGFTTIMGISKLYLIGNKTYEKDLGLSSIGNITRIENLSSDIESQLSIYENRLNGVKKDLEHSKEQVNKPFEQEERLAYLIQRKLKIDYNIENGIIEEINKEDLQENLIVDDNRVIEDTEIKEPLKIEEVEKFINEQIEDKPIETKITNKANDITEPPKIDITQDRLNKEIYSRLYHFGKDVLDGKKEYLQLEANGFDRLVLEKIDSNEYSLAHYSTLNGDAMRSPEITFKVENERIEPTSYLDDYVAKYQGYEEIKESPKLLLEIKEFFNGWLKNITEQFKLTIENLKNKNIEPRKLEKLRKEYIQGDLVRLEHMDNEDLLAGSIGFIKNVDDMGQVHVLWQNGSNLALNLDVDRFRKLEMKNLPISQQFIVDDLRQKFKDTIYSSNNIETNKKEQLKKEEKINKRS